MTVCTDDDLNAAQSAESVSATDHRGKTVEITTADSVVYFAPNTGGCRCSATAMQLDQIREKQGRSVFGVFPDEPDALAEFREEYDIEHTLISDTDGSVSKEFGIPYDDHPERAVLFFRDGEPQDSPLAGGEVGQADLNQAEDVPEVVQTLEHPSVAVITGKRGAGKSSLAYHLAEEMADRDGTIPVTVGLPKEKEEALPDRWMNVESLEAAPHQAVIVVDEAYAKFHAREAMQNIGMAEVVNQSRHCDRSILFVTQNSSHLDKTGVSEADAIFMKEPGPFHMRFERRGVRDMTEQAKSSFDQLPSNMDSRQYTYVFTDETEGLVETDEADWYGDALAKSYSSACGTNETGKENLSEPVPCVGELPDGKPAFAFVHGDGSSLGRLNQPPTNMTVEEVEKVTKQPGFDQWASERDAEKYDGYVRDTMIPRTKAVIRGDANEEQRQTVESFISRMKAVDAGEREYKAFGSEVSAKTMSLWAWGYDTTGRWD